VLFGGITGGVGPAPTMPFGDTWTWNGSTWTQLAVTGPSPREHAAASTLDGVTVLFGGSHTSTDSQDQNIPLGDTWTWDGASWTQYNGTGPSPRCGHAMAALNGTVVLFGGSNTQFTDVGARMGDTWIWDGGGWTELKVPGPAPRFFHVMATLNGQVVLFGGNGSNAGNASNAAWLDDTWTWDGTSWTQLSVVGPTPGFEAAATLGDMIVLYWSAVGSHIADTWTWDGTSWNELHVDGPPWRGWAAAASHGSTVVLFGGRSSLDVTEADTWVWDGGSWNQRHVAGPSPRLAQTMSGP
jgi:hypothetical protein